VVLVNVLAGLLVLSAAGFYLGVLYAAFRFRASAAARPSRESGPEPFAPPISVLKPVAGGDPDFYANIRSHAAQQYREFELLFGVSDPSDPAIEAIRRLAREFPERRIEVLVCSCSAAGNTKVQRLEQLVEAASFNVLLISDSDVRVGHDYLARVVGPLEDPATGLVTCLYRARPGGSLPSLLDALWTSATFPGQVLLARLLQRVRFGLGATMALRRSELEAIGGFAALRPFLADDYQLGERIAALGRRIVLSSYPVEIVLAPDRWRDVWRRQLRWSRTVRASRPAGHAGLLVTHGSLWSLLALALAAQAPVLAVLALWCFGLQLAAAWVVGRGCLGAEPVKTALWLMPLAELLGSAVWVASFFGNRVRWRGRLIELGKAGRIRRVGPAD